MYYIAKYHGGIKTFLNRFGLFVVATNSLWEFPSVANARYTFENMVAKQEKEYGRIVIVGPKGGEYPPSWKVKKGRVS
jgi:hypothetical protein